MFQAWLNDGERVKRKEERGRLFLILWRFTRQYVTHTHNCSLARQTAVCKRHTAVLLAVFPTSVGQACLLDCCFRFNVALGEKKSQNSCSVEILTTFQW